MCSYKNCTSFASVGAKPSLPIVLYSSTSEAYWGTVSISGFPPKTSWICWRFVTSKFWSQSSGETASFESSHLPQVSFGDPPPAHLGDLPPCSPDRKLFLFLITSFWPRFTCNLKQGPWNWVLPSEARWSQVFCTTLLLLPHTFSLIARWYPRLGMQSVEQQCWQYFHRASPQRSLI